MTHDRQNKNNDNNINKNALPGQAGRKQRLATESNTNKYQTHEKPTKTTTSYVNKHSLIHTSPQSNTHTTHTHMQTMND